MSKQLRKTTNFITPVDWRYDQPSRSWGANSPTRYNAVTLTLPIFLSLFSS